MLLAGFISAIRARWERHRLYRRLVLEIMDLTDQDIADMGGERGDMLRHTYLRVYGVPHS